MVHEASEEFQGTSYNLLTRNCNHFTAHLCRRLTGRPGPAWLNRAASIGLALPCVVPREWIETPDYDDQGGELLEEGEGGDDDDDGEYGTSERSIMLRNTSSDQPRVAGTTADDDGERSATHHGSGSGSSARSRVRRDTSSGATASLPADLVVNRSAISGSRASRRGSNGGRGSIESSDGRGSDSADERVVAEVPDSEWDSAEERRRGGSGKDKKSRSRLP